MKAIILAGGSGTRLAPYTTVLPKPLMPIEEYPILEILIRQLVEQGIGDITLNVGYLAELIKAYFMQRPALMETLRLSYVFETKPLGTAGSLALVSGLDETFLVMNGDILTTLDFRDLVAHHRSQNAALTIATHEKQVCIDLGVLVMDENRCVVDYREKPSLEYSVSMGIYVYEPRALRCIEADTHLDFPDLVLKLISNGEKVVSYQSRDLWFDIGRQEDYQLAVQEFKNNRARFGAAFG